METIKLCPKCASPLPKDAPAGICPKCLLNAGFESQSGAAANPMTGFTPPEPAELAKHFPQLEILEMLGAGGMGVVYKARQVALDRIVAVKILPPSTASDPAFAERFAREARALAKLSHPNIVGVYDFGQAGPYYYFLMEFVDGVNLRQMISAQRIAPREALAIVPQVCDALQYAHDLGVVHRDIKPENLLVDRRGRVRIADFGLARLLGPVTDMRLTQSQHIMGTPHYMAPEQFEKPLEVDHRADIYSLGVVFYEMLTGELPLGRFDLPSHKVQVDVRLDDIVLKTLAKEPDRRYQHASDVKSEMEMLGGVPVANLPAGMRTVFGSEYKSPTTIGGWPMVHLAFGVDPKTGQQRKARGIIAIGNKATGVVAIGGTATGFFAFGGMAVGVLAVGGIGVGVFTYAGLALALLFAYGGLAVGALAYGGFTIGYAAIGGWACGYYAMGGVVHGIHKVGRHFNDPAAREFFQHFQWVTKPSFTLWAWSIFAVMFAPMFGAKWWLARRELATQRNLPARPHFSRTAIVGAVLAAFVPIALVAYLFLWQSRIPSAAAPVTTGASAATPADVQPNPIAAWRGEGNADDAGKEFHGALVGPVDFVPGVRGKAFRFNGNSFVRIPDSPALRFTNAFAIEMWFKRDDAESFGGLIDKRDLDNVCNFGVHMSKEWVFHVYFWDPKNLANGKYQNSFSPLPKPGVFHHLVATWQQIGTRSVEVKTFLDGALVQSDVFPGNLANTLNDAPISIGTVREGKAGSMFRGVIDEVALYDRVLSEREVKAAYDVGANVNASKAKAPLVPAPEPQRDAFLKVIAVALGLLGLLAPFGTTICGMMAIGEIRRSNGLVYGMPLAVADALLFPLIFLNALLAAGAIFLADLIGSPAARAFGAVFGVALGIGISALLAILTWRAVNKPVEQIKTTAT